MKGSLLLYNLKLNCLIFFSTSHKQLTDYIYTDIYTVNYRNALDRLRVYMNIILFQLFLLSSLNFHDTRYVAGILDDSVQ